MNSLEILAKKAQDDPIEKSGDIYHPIPFEEFSGLKTSSKPEAVTKKWELIHGALKDVFGGEVSGKKVLDVGSNAGFYTFNFAKLGNSVTSFEFLERYSEIALAIVEEKKLDVNWNASAFHPEVELPHKKYDVALLLSVYQWMADEMTKMDYANNCLRKISEVSDYLIFELGFNKGKSCIKTNKLNHYHALVDLIKKNTDYKYVKLVGKTRLWRTYSRFLIICSNDERFQDTGLRKTISNISI